MWILRFLLVLYEQGETELDNVLDVLLNRDGNPNNEVIGDIVMDSGEWGRHKYKLRHFNLTLQCSSTQDLKQLHINLDGKMHVIFTLCWHNCMIRIFLSQPYSNKLISVPANEKLWILIFKCNKSIVVKLFGVILCTFPFVEDLTLHDSQMVSQEISIDDDDPEEHVHG